MKVTLGGERFDHDGTKFPMSEALAIEKVYQRRFVEWQSDLEAGSAKAFCVLAWIIWRRDGRNIQFEDILSGAVDFDLNEMILSIAESVEAEQKARAEAEAEAAEGVNPTRPAPGPGGTATTGTGTSASSPKGSASVPGKPASSKSRTSKR